MKVEPPNHMLSLGQPHIYIYIYTCVYIYMYMYNPTVFSSFSFHEIVCDRHQTGVYQEVIKFSLFTIFIAFLCHPPTKRYSCQIAGAFWSIKIAAMPLLHGVVSQASTQRNQHSQFRGRMKCGIKLFHSFLQGCEITILFSPTSLLLILETYQ